MNFHQIKSPEKHPYIYYLEKKTHDEIKMYDPIGTMDLLSDVSKRGVTWSPLNFAFPRVISRLRFN